ncbi:hypothetical protein EHEL_091980 [Encephalitozoon hellem ATCC 50504]|uniref:Integrator complex subunit 3 n=1 Tax=Encephalitozoon hellem TaxID=27973 RepID=A0A9Q9C1R9_ENCHE|nr:uncharacterized protein EHEL_091980 [Encephalitozoon hellem ATCC 50504]AFM99090.1 hypothetical protein EHEL_091980 [Encephalitozoon hellem ATCC 50504]UTX42496.1 integrator complex subunit 3 [Encephalitozoon hellem]WEL37942.1 integrator complex subunit 3 [Encephalitozoon hellem]|eukprot:XP_003888071.1 hypothetical protein EHEL_091980 [Encephalitozoon hellem ATCC 50504]
MLKELIDEDDFCKKLRMSKEANTKAGFYSLFYILLHDPSLQVLESLLSNYTLQDVVNGLKHLIKFKFDRLTKDAYANILFVVRMMLDYEENIDTLIINLLRHHLVEEVYSMYKDKSRYFSNHPNSLMFLMFFCAQSNSKRDAFEDSNFTTRDFLFTTVREMITNPHFDEYKKKRAKKMSKSASPEYPDFPFASYFSSKQLLQTLLTPTPLNILSSQLSVELEMNIMFILEHEQNFKFHLGLLFRNYIRNEDDACRALRFIVNIPYPQNIARLANSILDKYPSSYLALIYDMLFWNQKEKLNGNLVEYLRGSNNKITAKLDSLQEEWEALRLAMESIKRKQENTVEDVIRMIHGLNFQKYFGLIKEMEKWGTPIVPREMYDRIIGESSEWDGYAQVYLWKIIGFQKIYLGFDVDTPRRIESLEALEGFEIVRNLLSIKKKP